MPNPTRFFRLSWGINSLPCPDITLPFPSCRINCYKSALMYTLRTKRQTMKTILLWSSLLGSLLGCAPLNQTVITRPCQGNTPISASYPKAKPVQELIDRYTRQGLPGIALAVYSPQTGYWAGASATPISKQKPSCSPATCSTARV